MTDESHGHPTEDDMVQLPNTEVTTCDHESHGGTPARAVTRIRFAVDGEVYEYNGCLSHRNATDFGYVPPTTDTEKLAAASEPTLAKDGHEFRSNADDDDALDEPEPITEEQDAERSP